MAIAIFDGPERAGTAWVGQEYADRILALLNGAAQQPAQQPETTPGATISDPATGNTPETDTGQ
jgi:hypothetical protein